MKKQELIKKIGSMPKGLEVCVFDYGKSVYNATDETTGEGIYPEFDVELIDEVDNPFIALTIKNDDYSQDGGIVKRPRPIKVLKYFEDRPANNVLKEALREYETMNFFRPGIIVFSPFAFVQFQQEMSRYREMPFNITDNKIGNIYYVIDSNKKDREIELI